MAGDGYVAATSFKYATIVDIDNETWRNTGTGSCFAEKGIELQAEMSVAQFLL